MRRRLSVFAAVGASLALVLSGCSDDKPGAAAPAPSAAPAAEPSKPSASADAGAGSGEAATWVDSFCGALTSMTTLNDIKPPAVSTDFEASKKSMIDILTKFEGAVTTTLDELNGLGPAPEKAGDDAKATLVALFTPVKDEIVDAKAKIETATQSNPQPMVEAGTSLQSMGSALLELKNPLKGIEASPELSAAGQKAPKCKALGG